MEKQASQVSTEDFQNGFKSSKVHDIFFFFFFYAFGKSELL